jgi:hypothetical protein
VNEILPGKIYRQVPISYLDLAPSGVESPFPCYDNETNSSYYVKLKSVDRVWHGETNGLVRLKSRSCLVLKANTENKTYVVIPFFSFKDEKNQRNIDLIKIRDPKFIHTYYVIFLDGYFDFRYIRSVHSFQLNSLQNELDQEMFDKIRLESIKYFFN